MRAGWWQVHLASAQARTRYTGVRMPSIGCTLLLQHTMHHRQQSALFPHLTCCSLCARSCSTWSVLAWMTSPAASACRSKSVSCMAHQPEPEPRRAGPCATRLSACAYLQVDDDQLATCPQQAASAWAAHGGVHTAWLVSAHGLSIWVLTFRQLHGSCQMQSTMHGCHCAPAASVRSGRRLTGWICRLVPRQMHRSAASVWRSASCSRSSGRADSQSSTQSVSLPLQPGLVHRRPVGLKPTCKGSIHQCRQTPLPAVHVGHELQG